MKAQKITIQNVGIIADAVVALDKPLICFYGDLMQGKSTILNAFKWCLGGSYPADIIRHGEKEASVVFEFLEDAGPGSISRSWYINKEGVTSSRPVSFIRAGKPVSRPDNEIKKFLNPYLLDNDFLKNMSEMERKQYFVTLFGVDTSDIDKEINAAADQAKTLRIEIKTYGEIDTTEVLPIDVTAVKSEKIKIVNEHSAAVMAHNSTVEAINKKYTVDCDAVAAGNRSVISHNDTRTRGLEQISDLNKSITDLEFRLNAAKENKQKICDWLDANPEKTEEPLPVRPELPNAPTTPDTSSFDAQISEAAAVAVKVEQYHNNLKRSEEKKTKEQKLSDNEAIQRELKKKKVARLSDAGKKSGIKGLVFMEDGSFTYKDTSHGMLSTSQLMDLSQELSALYPAGFGLDLIDRAESLGFAIGKNILEFVEKAKREEKTIMAAIVGERPAQSIPDEVGVFVVSNGEVK
jgi:DNA repair exonuclease SbcCD ATPase subunit